MVDWILESRPLEINGTVVMEIDICVCTFRRPHLAETLQSLSQLALRPDWNLRVIVADNDETPSAENLAVTTAQQYGLKLIYVHAPARNISVARNACLDAAQASLVAFVDDDEVVTPGWLEALVAEQEKSQADVVLGQVQSTYDPKCPAWMREGDFHTPKPSWVNGQIITGYTCNVLFQRKNPVI